MKTLCAAFLLLLFGGCEHASQPAGQPVSTSTHETGVASLDSIGTQSDSSREIEFRWRDSSGAIHSLSDYKGTTVLLNFWATWCPPCKEELPALEDIAEHSGDTITVIGVSVDQANLQYLRQFVDTQKLSYQFVLDSSSALYGHYASAFHESWSIPQTYIIGKSGMVKFALVGSQTEQAFEDYIAKAN